MKTNSTFKLSKTAKRMVILSKIAKGKNYADSLKNVFIDSENTFHLNKKFGKRQQEQE